jgi:transcriptional regulator with XRE-family HTH domain
MLTRTRRPVRLVTVRGLKGLSLATLASEAKLSPQTIYKIEKGLSKRIQPATIKALADALKIDARDVDEFRGPLGLPPLAPE